MSNVPEGALRSEDGQWWWDGQQWLLVEDGGSAADEGNVDAERAAARREAGYPVNPDHLTDEQKTALLGQPQVTSETLSQDMVDVVAMDDHGSENGEVLA